VFASDMFNRSSSVFET